jgi:hypothetical protein
MSNNKEVTKAPIGLIPKRFHEWKVKATRLEEIQAAISRYYEAGLKINIEWVEEYNELVQYLEENKIQ